MYRERECKKFRLSEVWEKKRDCAMHFKSNRNESVRPMKFAKNFAIPTGLEGPLANPSIALLGQRSNALIIFLLL